MQKNIKFSILMSLYAGEKEQYLRECLKSIQMQQLAPNEIVIVIDGKISDLLEDTLLEYESKRVRYVRLNDNMGLGYALNAGLAECRYDLVARVDTDDINCPHRFLVQMAVMGANSEVSVLGGHVEEIDESGQSMKSFRRVSITHEEISRALGHRNPFNHPTVMFRKAAVQAVGGYPMCRYGQDYHLWARLFSNGCHMQNIDDVLVQFRVSRDFYARRGGLSYIKYDLNLMREMHSLRILSRWGFIRNMAVRTGTRISPLFIRRLIYCGLRSGGVT